MKIIFTRGFPGAGKSTWSERFCAANGAVNVNMDSIRESIGTPDDHTSGVIPEIRDHLISIAMLQGKDIVVSDTNLKPSEVKEIVKSALDNGYEPSFEDFRVGFDTLLKRNRERPERDRVPEAVIRDMWKRYPMKQWKTMERIVAEIESRNVSYEPFSNDPSLPPCVLVDVDGTLAHHDNLRSPFDWSSVGQDRPDATVIEAVRDIYNSGTEVIIMSGRSRECYEVTCAWLVNNGVPFHRIFMRPEGDNRPDYQVKDSLVRKYIEGNYHVRYCLDDRDQVVNHYRSIGLKVFQVEPGDF